MRAVVILLVCVTCTLLTSVDVVSAQGLQKVTIGLVIDGDSPRYGSIEGTLRREIMDLLTIDYDVSLPESKVLIGDWTVAGADRAIAQLLGDREVNLVLCVGPITTRAAADRGAPPKPIVALAGFNADIHELPEKNGASGIRNFHYLMFPRGEDLSAFADVATFSQLAVLVEGAHLDALPKVEGYIVNAAAAYDTEPQIVRVEGDVKAALETLDKDVDAVWVLPLFQTDQTDFDALVDGLIARGLPSFSSMGVIEVRDGILSGLKPADFTQRVARRMALNAQRILRGENAGDIPVVFAIDDALTINMETARAIQVYPRWRILVEAELIANDTRSEGRLISLESAVDEAVAKNLDLLALDHALAAGEEEVDIANSILWPQIGVSTDYTVIDDDRAAAGLGLFPERTWTVSGTLTQIIYDDRAWANRSIQSSIQESRVLDREALKLDIALGTAVTYLDILRASTFERIQKNNLALTRENLKLAQIRKSVGTASPGEVYRWQAELAGARQSVIEAQAERNLAEIELNRLLHHPLEEPFVTEENESRDPELMNTSERLLPYIDNPWSFDVYRDFMAKEALETSPELMALTAAQKAQSRVLTSTRRDFWLPTLALQAGIDEWLDRSGAGSEVGGGSLGFPTRDDTDWFVGLQLSYPLFTGGARFSINDKASEELVQIGTEKAATAQRIEQRVRSALHRLGASLSGIELSREAAVATRANYGLVSDAYRRGAISIIDLLDAQNAALAADESSANAEFNFMIDMVNVQRATGRMQFFMVQEETDAYFERLDAFFADARENQ